MAESAQLIHGSAAALELVPTDIRLVADKYVEGEKSADPNIATLGATLRMPNYPYTMTDDMQRGRQVRSCLKRTDPSV